MIVLPAPDGGPVAELARALRLFHRECREADAAGREAPGRFLQAWRLDDEAPRPAAVGKAFEFYFRHIEARDIGKVSLHLWTDRGRLVYVVWVTTDGDDGWIELFDAEGCPLGAARVVLDRIDWGPRDAIRAGVRA